MYSDSHLCCTSPLSSFLSSKLTWPFKNLNLVSGGLSTADDKTVQHFEAILLLEKTHIFRAGIDMT